MIYLIKEDWNNLILSKLSENESFNEQFLELKKMHQAFHFFINKMSQTKEKIKNEYQNLRNNLFIASMAIFHKYRICSNFSLNKYSSEELYIIIGACIFIAQKAINALWLTSKEFSDIIQAVLQKKEPNKKIIIDEIKEKIKNKEIEILALIGFNIDVDSPVSFCNKVKNYISKTYLNLKSDNLFELLKIFMDDSLILPLSLYYTPNTITISCILSLKKKFNLQYINIKELISLSDYYLDLGEIQECTSLINKLENANKEYYNELKNKTKASSNIKTNDTNTMNSNQASVTKVIPSIKMNID